MEPIIQVLEADVVVVDQVHVWESRTSAGNFSIDAVDDVWWCVMSWEKCGDDDSGLWEFFAGDFCHFPDSISSVVAQRVEVISPGVDYNTRGVSCEVSDDLLGVACCAASLCSDFLMWEEFLWVQELSIRVHEEKNIWIRFRRVGR